MKITAIALLALTSVQAFSNNPSAFVRPNQQVGRGQAYTGRLFAEPDTALSKQLQSDMIDKELQQLEQDLAATPAEALATPQQLKKLAHVLEMVTEHATDEDDELRGGSPSPATKTFHKLPPSKQDISDIVNGLLVPKPSLEEARERAGLVQEEPQGFIQSILDTQKTLLETIRTMSAAGEDLGYEQYPTHPEFPDISLADMPKMRATGLTNPPPFEYSFSVGRVVSILKRIMSLMAGFKLTQREVAASETAQERAEAWFSPSKIHGLPNPLKGLVPKPELLIREYMNDQEFARQYLAGTNPVSIRVCKNPSKQLTPALLKFFKNQGKDINELAAEKRLLFADYKELLAAKANPHSAYPHVVNPDVPESDDNLRYFEAAVVVFELDSVRRQDMDVLAIQLKQEVEDAEVYSKSTSSEAEWFMAKTMVRCADANVHEFLDHLGETHLFFEAQVVALHNTIRKNKHPLWDFFQPLTKDTLFLNWAARNSLFSNSPRSFSDEFASVGTGQIAQLLQNRWKNYDFFARTSLPNELANRGFDKDFELPGYLFREDGLRIWEAMGEFTANFVDEVYPTDEDVAKDSVVQAWATEMTDSSKAGVRGFPTAFKDRATLALAMQCMWWVASALHGAINTSQYDYYAFTPNRPLSLKMNMEQFKEQGDDTLEFIFENVLPGDLAQANLMLTTHLLTMPSDVHIDELADHYSKTKYGMQSYDTFLKRLKVIGEDIEARNKKNKKEGNAVYPYLHPSNVPASIDI